jgi:hypothetical protein
MDAIMEMTFKYRKLPGPDAGFGRMKDFIRRDLVRQLFRKNLEERMNTGHPLSSSKEVSVA